METSLSEVLDSIIPIISFFINHQGLRFWLKASDSVDLIERIRCLSEIIFSRIEEIRIAQ